jgi:hypothetical protein
MLYRTFRKRGWYVFPAFPHLTNWCSDLPEPSVSFIPVSDVAIGINCFKWEISLEIKAHPKITMPIDIPG